jgi:uncharacterized membrane protein
MSRDRLDLPKEPRRKLKAPSVDTEAFGQWSERIARFIGTGRFLVGMTIVVVIWVGWNVFAPRDLRFDEYPYIFLTLALSLQASYAAPLILLAQNRQADRDRVNLEQDREATARARADMEFLAREIASIRIAMGEVTTRDYVRAELRELAEELRASKDGQPVNRGA